MKEGYRQSKEIHVGNYNMVVKKTYMVAVFERYEDSKHVSRMGGS